MSEEYTEGTWVWWKGSAGSQRFKIISVHSEEFGVKGEAGETTYISKQDVVSEADPPPGQE